MAVTSAYSFPYDAVVIRHYKYASESPFTAFLKASNKQQTKDQELGYRYMLIVKWMPFTKTVFRLRTSFATGN